MTRPLAPRYNIAPLHPVEVIRYNNIRHQREIIPMQWGLIPHWSKDPKIASKLFNARAETINEKPSFRGSFRHRRSVIPADSFYEWQTINNGKQPWRIFLATKEPMIMAGLWESWLGADGSEIETCCIITTSASQDMTHIHNRMPVIFDSDQIAAWLDPDARAKDLQPLLQPLDQNRLSAEPVTRDVGKTENDGPYLHHPVPLAAHFHKTLGHEAMVQGKLF